MLPPRTRVTSFTFVFGGAYCLQGPAAYTVSAAYKYKPALHGGCLYSESTGGE